jgi:excisionase family DNA binding protein
MDERKFVTVSELAGILRVNRLSVLKLIKKGTINAFKVGKVYRIDQTEIEKLGINNNKGSAHGN